MCRICTKAKTLAPQEALNLIATAMQKGRNPEHFDKIMDDLLGTKIPEKNNELDAAWEAEYKPKP